MAGSSVPSRAETAQILTQVGRLLADANHQIAITIQQMEQRLEHLRHVRNTLLHQGQHIAHPPICEGSSGTSVQSNPPPPLNLTYSICGSGAHPPPSSTPSSTGNSPFPHLDSSQGFSVTSGSQMYATEPAYPQPPFPIPVASSTVNAALSEFPQTGALTRELIPRPPPRPQSPCSPVGGPPQNRTVQTQSRTQTQASAATSSANFTGTAGSGNPPSPDVPPIQHDYQIVRCPECRARVGVYFEIYHLDQ